MKNIFWLFVSILLVSPLYAQGQQTNTSSMKTVPAAPTASEERLEKIHALEMEVVDTAARQWAFQIKNGVSHTSLEDLKQTAAKEENPRPYIHKFLSLVEKYLGQKEIPFITPEEWEKFEENQQQIEKLRNNGQLNAAIEKRRKMDKKITALRKPIFELDARHWAWRIAEVKDTTLEQLRSYSVQWVGEGAENARLILAIEENLKNGNTKRPSDAEMKKLRKTHEQIRKLINKTKL